MKNIKIKFKIKKRKIMKIRILKFLNYFLARAFFKAETISVFLSLLKLGTLCSFANFFNSGSNILDKSKEGFFALIWVICGCVSKA